MVADDPWIADLVPYQKPRCGRVRLNRHGARSRSHISLEAEQHEREPWLLVASPSLGDLRPHQIVNLYAKRIQIEQSFRDLKCALFG